MFIIVKNACWIRGVPSSRAAEKFLEVRDSKIVGNSMVFSLQMWEMDTAALVLKGSLVTVW